MYKDIFLVFPQQGEELKNNQYVDVSEQEVQELAIIVREMYRNNNIPYKVTKKVNNYSSPTASVTINSKGINFCLGFRRKAMKIIKITPKGEL